MFYCTFYFFKIVLCAVNLSHDKKSSLKHDCDNNHELEPKGIEKRCVAGIIFLGKSNCSSVFEAPQEKLFYI